MLWAVLHLPSELPWGSLASPHTWLARDRAGTVVPVTGIKYRSAALTRRLSGWGVILGSEGLLVRFPIRAHAWVPGSTP